MKIIVETQDFASPFEGIVDMAETQDFASSFEGIMDMAETQNLASLRQRKFSL